MRVTHTFDRAILPGSFLVVVKHVTADVAHGIFNWRTSAIMMWEMLLPSQFASRPRLLKSRLATRMKRRGNPLELLTELTLQYTRRSNMFLTALSGSPIDAALQAPPGRVPDFAHIMIALVRQLKSVPLRQRSMFHNDEEGSRKDRSIEGASHAWTEALGCRRQMVAFTRPTIYGRRPPYSRGDLARLCRCSSNTRRL